MSRSVLKQRASGVVLHFSSLPGPHGSGDLGPAAWRFVDWLASAGQSVWQVLPLNPPGPGNSSYQSPSAFAGSPGLVALEPLVDAGWLAAPVPLQAGSMSGAEAVVAPPSVDELMHWRWQHLRRAASAFFERAKGAERAAFERWQAGAADWLPDWTLFASLKDAHQGRPWWEWAPALARRDAAALNRVRQQLAPEVAAHAFVQWCFDTQLAALRGHASGCGVRLMGDLPIFVAHDSADVWSRPDLYFLDDQHQPTVVAGVPPDGYSPEGQRWGNPLYRWPHMAEEAYVWWVARLRRALMQADIFRIDHFRGFAAYWEIVADCPTALQGRWVNGPGAALFEALHAALGVAVGELPIVAEDLGLMTPDVAALRDGFGLPGMRIVYEGLMRGDEHAFLPHHHVPNGLVYSSTHDSDTCAGWWAGAPVAQRQFAGTYLGISPSAQPAEAAQAVWRATSTSVARLALAPLQDLLGLGSAHRMNRPGTSQGNWAWRFDWPMLPAALPAQLRRLAEVTGRLPAQLRAAASTLPAPATPALAVTTSHTP